MADSRQTWASCALTQLGFIRLYLTPAVVGTPKPAAEAMSTLAGLVADPRHRYWEPLPPPRAQDLRWVHGAAQVTDSYLLALARRYGGRLLTFDARLEHLAAHPGEVEILGR